MATLTASRPVTAALAFAVLLATGRPAPATGDPAAVRRILLLLSAAAEEYREALDDAGRVVRPLEIAEARVLLAEAREQFRRQGGALADEGERRLASLATALEAAAPAGTVPADLEAVRRWLTEASGVADDATPPVPPSAARGQTIFAEQCASCHGARGAGDGLEATPLALRPADFTDPAFMRGETPSDFFHVVSVGKRLGGMPAWGDVLSVQERWDVVSYLWSLTAPPQAIAEGQGVFLAQCAGCHGATGDGHGPFAATLRTPVPNLSALDRLARRTDADLFALVSEGVPGTAMPAYRTTLDEAARWKAVAFVRWLSLGGLAGEQAGAVGPAARSDAAEARLATALAETRRLLDAGVEGFRRGDAAAGDRVTDAYLRFEPWEKRIGAHDPALVRRVEEGFLALRVALRDPGGAADVERITAALHADLAAAAESSRRTAGAYARFAQSATIILREGFEAVLIIGALLAYVARTGAPAMRRPIYLGAGAGFAASLATAVALSTVLRLSPGAGEVLEGVTMLLAALVLFWVSYWIVSKAEADRWQRYIQGKVKAALAAESGGALAATAFLAVYREGFETVLFYQALVGSAPAGDAMVGAGFVAGAALLAVVYVVFTRLGLRIPMRPFFLATGALLYAMAIVFAGQGVHELQSAGAIGVTAVPGMPTLEFLGVYPSAEPLVAQGLLVLLLVVGAGVTLRRRRARLAAQRMGPRRVHDIEPRVSAGNRRA